MSMGTNLGPDLRPNLHERQRSPITMKHILWLLPVSLFLGCSRQPSQAADNTRNNSRDSSGETLTPPDQYENEIDRALTQNVRKALMDDTTLSTNAKNIKVITRDGTVTLRGVVASAAEKQGIVAKVEMMVGVQECDDQLEVKTN